MTKKTIILLFAIIGLAFILRIYNITITPPSPDWDEAALGYNAFSILKTGKDEFGNLLPLTLRSFNDYKPAFYVYTAISSVSIFGLNIFAVRLPSVIMGTLSILGMFFLAELLRKQFKNIKLNSNFSLLSALMLAISPWHLQFSRGAFEVTSGFFLLIWGGAFLLKGLEKPRFLSVSALFFSLSLYAYHATRIFVPLFLTAFLIIHLRKLISLKKYLIAAILIGFILSMPAVSIMFSREGRQRLSGVSVYGDQVGFLRDSVSKIIVDRNEGISFGNLFHNRRIAYINAFVEGYMWHFTPRWLFLSGENIFRHHAPDMGLLYLFELPFILFGIYKTLRNGGSAGWFIFSWLLLAPVASAPTVPVPHAIRSFYMLIPLVFFSAVGTYLFLQRMTKTNYGIFLITIFLAFTGFNFIYYLDSYHRHLSNEYSLDWQYGYKEMYQKAFNLEKNYKKIVVSGKLEQPYIFYLFYSQYDPKAYQQQGGSNRIDFNNWSSLVLGKYEFKQIDWSKEMKSPDILYIGKPSDFQGTYKVIDTINYLNGSTAIYLVEG